MVNEASGPNSSGFCMCGCGQKTSLARATDRKKGYVKGQPVLYISGHQGRIRGEGPNPSGFCMCGCGRKTSIARVGVRSLGYVQGQPVCYVRGHNRRSPRP